MKLTYSSRKEQESIVRALTKISPEIAEIFAGRATVTMGNKRQRFVRQVDHRGLVPPGLESYVGSKEVEIVLRLQPYAEPLHD